MSRARAAPTAAAPAAAGGPARPAKGRRELPALVYGFDVQFLLEGPNLDVEAIRTQIAAMGDCPLVEGDSRLVKVHVHVPNPGAPLSYAVGLGFVTDVVVENMDDMAAAMQSEIAQAPPSSDEAPLDMIALRLNSHTQRSDLIRFAVVAATAPGLHWRADASPIRGRRYPADGSRSLTGAS